MVKITFSYDPTEAEEDNGDDTGLSEKGFNAVMDAVVSFGGYDIEIEKAT